MEMFDIITALISALITLTTVGVPAVIALVRAIKKRTAAKTEADKEKARADLLATAKNFISAAEVAFEGFDRMMKAQGLSAGSMKKDTVFTKLQAYALQNGYDFDSEAWSEQIDELVAFTKSVNAKKN